MRVLLMVMAIRRCRPVTRRFVAAGVAASMLERPTLAHRDRKRTVNRNGEADQEQQQESGKCVHCWPILPQVGSSTNDLLRSSRLESTFGRQVTDRRKIY